MLKFKDNYKILRTVLQFNTSIEQLHLVEPPPILDGYTSPIALDFKALAKHFKIPLAKNSKLKEIYFSQGAVFIHAAGVKIARNSAQPPRPPVLSSPLL